MTAKAEISIWDSATRAVLVQSVAVDLPLTIGRVGKDGQGEIKDAAGQSVTFGTGLTTMSREHMRVEAQADGGALVTDASSNGIARIVPGQPPMHLGRNRKEEMQPGSMRQFETVGLVIEVALPKLSRMIAPAELYASYESSSAGGARALPLSPACLVLRDVAGEVQIEQRKDQNITDALAKSGADALAVIGPGDGGVAVLPARDGAVMCNRRVLQSAAQQALEHLDTLEIGPLTLYILAKGAGRALVCVNPECRQMNAHVPGGNCRYCGTRLGDAMTRMLPKEGGQ